MNLGTLKCYQIKDNRVHLFFENGEANVYFITDEIVRFEIPLELDDYQSVAIEGDKVKKCNFVETITARGTLLLCNEKLRIEISDDFHVDIWDDRDNILMSDYRGEREYNRIADEIQQDLLEAEGHDTSNLKGKNFAVQTMKCIDEDDCFYGLGDKPGFLNKRNFAYENWNSDITNLHNENMPALYKSIPFFICKKINASYGLFFDNTFHSYMDFGKECSRYFFYGAEAGNLNYYFINGKSMADVISGYTYLTGFTPMPQLWSLGYHQCRWSYETSDEIREIANKMRENRIPCDSIQYDIDYMDGYRVFTWNEKNFGVAGEIFKDIGTMGFKPVVIIDPAVKLEKGYKIYDEGCENNYFATDSNGEIYVNRVWPGAATYPDFGKAAVRQWWAANYKFLTDLGVQAVWNDMNEPASFDGPLPDDVVMHIYDRKTTHKEAHNVYAHFENAATYEGLIKLTGKRPFVITRAAYAGSQKYAAAWTGDNQSTWSHLRLLIPQLCSLGISGFPFVGTDIGGFAFDTNPELITRWIEAAVFSPFFRNHSGKGSRRQEPWRFNDRVLEIYRKYVELRYRFIPYIYDLFYQGQKSGLPIMRPLVLHYEDDENTYNLNDEYLVGENVLVSPVVEQGATQKLVYLPAGDWYDFWTGECIAGGRYIIREAQLDICPIYIKAGSLIPTYDVVQYVGEKPYDELILLSTPGKCEYTHYADNGEDFDYQDGAFNLYKFVQNEKGNVDIKLLHKGYKKYKEIRVVSIKDFNQN